MSQRLEKQENREKDFWRNHSVKTQRLQHNILNAGIAIAQYPDVGSGRLFLCNP
ncbi:hypothetical protein I8752_31450 [Nostocaceae cyanobacterium CENA369]|uniref:Uncharacterized protein n=1 Tax=Dendronalium phyllosphericum CENA369 TaxID=1725256 RepID=A0A8J7IKS9_9NOST|nr:hypothetical protein [Dendronalium phyllosphericum]MBH8577407.1 hypothetical protein [Dendronalium phyllosphericum CENA369]